MLVNGDGMGIGHAVSGGWCAWSGIEIYTHKKKHVIINELG